MTKKTAQNEQDVSVELAKAAIQGIEEKKGKNIKALDLRKIPNSICDFFIICEGDSTTQVSAIADSVADEVKKLTNKRPHHIEGMQNAEWVLVDYIDVVVHVFQPEVRHFYKLESLWADATIFEPNGPAKKEAVAKVEINTLPITSPKADKKAPAKKPARLKNGGKVAAKPVKPTVAVKKKIAKKVKPKAKVVKKAIVKKSTKKAKTAVKPVKKAVAKKIAKKSKSLAKPTKKNNAKKNVKKAKAAVKKKIANKKKK